MELITADIPAKDERIVLAPIGDIQWNGDEGATAEGHLKRHIARCLDLGAWFIGMGDYIDFASPSNRARLASARLYDTASKAIETTAEGLVEQVFSRFLKPTVGRWIGLLEGHHFYEFQGQTSDTILAGKLKTRALGTSCYIRLKPCGVTIWAHHGTGGGILPSAPLNKLYHAAAGLEGADVYLMGHTCLTTRARIMTRSGFKRHDEVLIGEEVLAYDIPNRRCTWTPLQDVTRYPSAPLYQLASKSFRAEMTPDHQWVMADYAGREALRTIEDAASNDRIITTRAADGGTLDLAPDDAAVLGWVVTDGCTIRLDKKTPDVRIVQKKPEYVAQLRTLLGDRASEYRREAGQSEFYLHVGYSRPLLERCGYHGKEDLPRIVTRLSVAAREAMMHAMLCAEGDGSSYFTQQAGPVLDAFLMLAALQGVRLGVRARAYDETRPIHIEGRRVTPTAPVYRVRILGSHAGPPDVAYMKREERPPGPVWCPTTQYGTWVAELDGQTFITGNTKMPVVRLSRPRPEWSVPPKLTHRDIFLVNTGGFSRSNIPGSRQGQIPRGDYAEQRMLTPSPLSAPLIHIDTTARRLEDRIRVEI